MSTCEKALRRLFRKRVTRALPCRFALLLEVFWCTLPPTSTSDPAGRAAGAAADGVQFRRAHTPHALDSLLQRQHKQYFGLGNCLGMRSPGKASDRVGWAFEGKVLEVTVRFMVGTSEQHI